MKPLQGIVVVEATDAQAGLGVRLAAALAGRIAADLAAEVVKIEPSEGDPLRFVPPLIGQAGALFSFLNAGKKSVVLPAGDNQVLGRLVRRCDAMLADAALAEKCAASVGADLPAGRASVCVSVSMLGSSVPPDVPASEFTVMALGGMLDIVGEPDREPLRLGGHQAAYSAGLSAFTGLVAALCGEPTADGAGTPERVEVSLLETAVWLNWKSVASAATGGRIPRRSGQGGDWPIVRCADGWVALVYQDADWPGILKLTGDDPRLADPALASLAARQARAAEIAAVIEETLLGLTRQQVHDLALKLRLPLGPVSSLSELAEDAHVLARGFLETVAGGMMMPRLPVLWNGKAFRPGVVPALGEVEEVPA